jgi:hypothetical protein
MTDVTLDVPDEIWAAVCQLAAEESLSVSDWVANLMRRELGFPLSFDSVAESSHCK